eukprot:6200796-Pleurochrysis_carterae.AAC.1
MRRPLRASHAAGVPHSARARLAVESRSASGCAIGWCHTRPSLSPLNARAVRGLRPTRPLAGLWCRAMPHAPCRRAASGARRGRVCYAYPAPPPTDSSAEPCCVHFVSVLYRRAGWVQRRRAWLGPARLLPPLPPPRPIVGASPCGSPGRISGSWPAGSSHRPSPRGRRHASPPCPRRRPPASPPTPVGRPPLRPKPTSRAVSLPPGSHLPAHHADPLDPLDPLLSSTCRRSHQGSRRTRLPSFGHLPSAAGTSAPPAAPETACSPTRCATHRRRTGGPRSLARLCGVAGAASARACRARWRP